MKGRILRKILPLAAVCAAVCSCALFSGCVGLFLLAALSEDSSDTCSNPVGRVKRYAGVDLTGCTVTYNYYDYGAFGDGETLFIFDCSDSAVSSQVEDWLQLPLSANLQIFTYGGERNGVTYGVSGTRKLIPEISDGKYYFYDRYANEYEDGSDVYSDEKLFSRASYNLTLALYDCSSDLFYFYMLDT